MRICLIFDLTSIVHGIGTKLVSNWEQNIYENLANFMCKKDIHVNRLESVIFGMQMCILQNKTECKGGT